VTAHQSLERRELGVLSALPRRRVQVNSQTMDHLRIAQRANNLVKAVLDSGAGNQAVDIAASGGESWARRQVGFESAPRGNMAAQIQRVDLAQGGNCPEHASFASAVVLRLGTEPETTVAAPVVRVWEGSQSLDHTYTLIGDPRAPEWGNHNTVLVDPWVVVPSASTLSEARLHNARSGTSSPFNPLGEGLFVDTFAPGTSEWHAMAGRAESVHPMSTDEMEQQLMKTKAMRRQTVSEFGGELAAHALRVEPDLIFDCRVSTNPETEYTDGNQVRTFDQISQATVDHLHRGIDALGRIGKG
jgi:hypothetical protein